LKNVEERLRNLEEKFGAKLNNIEIKVMNLRDNVATKGDIQDLNSGVITSNEPSLNVMRLCEIIQRRARDNSEKG